MHKGTYFALAAITVVGGFALGRAFKSSGDNEATTGTVETAPSPMAAGGAVPGDVDRKRVPLEGEFRGPADALVNIVVFSDFQCPFCGRVNPTLEKLTRSTPARCGCSSSTTPCPSTRTRRWRRRRRWPPAPRASSGRCTTSCSPTSRR